MQRPGRMAALILAPLLALLGVLVALGVASTSPGDGATSGGPPTAVGTGPAPAPAPETLSPEAAEYVESCRRANASLATADVVYPTRLTMVRGETTTVRVAVTLLTDLPPEKVLDTGLVDAQPATRQVLVTCTIQARLLGAAADFTIEDRDWLSQTLLTSPTATWTWFVTPKRESAVILTLQVRPVVLVRGDRAGTDELPTQATTAEFPITTFVSVPTRERAQEQLDAVTGLLTSVEGAIAALVALLLAFLGLRRFLPGHGVGKGVAKGDASTTSPDVVDLTDEKTRSRRSRGGT